jgi:hypothetical protein
MVSTAVAAEPPPPAPAANAIAPGQGQPPKVQAPSPPKARAAHGDKPQGPLPSPSTPTPEHLTLKLGVPTSTDGVGIMPPIPKGVTPAAAAMYCRTMEVNARGYARYSTAWGWVVGVLAAGAIATGPVIVASDSTPSSSTRAVELAVPATGFILGYVANALFTRAKDHGALAAQASLALNLTSPDDQVAACNTALAAWNTARSESSLSIAAAIAQQHAGTDADAQPAR